MSSSSVRLTHPLFVGIGVLAASFFAFCALAAWFSGQGAVSPFFLIFVALGLYVWLSAGETELNDLHVRHRSYLGTHSLRWDEVSVVEFDPQGQAVLFRGQNKRLVVPGVAAWPRAQRERALQLLDEQIQRRSIEVRDNLWAAYQWSKNTREPL